MSVETTQFNDLLNGLSSGEVEELIRLAMNGYKRAVTREFKAMAAELSEDKEGQEIFTAECLRIARCATSTWSGGHSAANACEQMRREVAIEYATKKI